MKKKISFAAIFASTLVTSSLAYATNGYFATGYGVKAQGFGGVSIALPHDSLVAAANPAGIAFTGDRFDIGFTLFRPDRSSEIVGNGGGNAVNGQYEGNSRQNFLIPEFGVSKQINSELSLGLAVYGKGGMNTSYTRPVPLLGQSKPGVNLEQIFVAPTLAWKLNPSQSLGISAIYARQKFSATGLENFTAPSGIQQASLSPSNVTGQGNSISNGFGFHLGWLGKLTESVSLGAHYQSKISAGEFDKYKGLFAEGGGFDIPASYGVGVAIKASPKLTVGADIEKIQYSKVASVANPLSNLFSGNLLGTANGPGFGWKDITVYKLGAGYQYSESLRVRVGYNYNTQPIPSSQTFFNILAPGVVQHHLSSGFTYALNKDLELSGYVAHAFNKQVNGTGSIPSAYGSGNVNVRLSENSLGIGLGWKY